MSDETKMRFVSASDVLANAEHHGIKLYVPPDKDVIRTDAERIPEELTNGIRAHKDQLIRDLLMQQAVDYLAKRSVSGADMSVLDEPGYRMNMLYESQHPLTEYRKAVRDYVTAGLREIRKARASRAS